MQFLEVGLCVICGLFLVAYALDKHSERKDRQFLEEEAAIAAKRRAEKLRNLHVNYVDVNACGLLISVGGDEQEPLFENLSGKRVPHIPQVSSIPQGKIVSALLVALHFDCYLGQMLDSGKWEPVRRGDVEPRLEDADFIAKHSCNPLTHDEIRERQRGKEGVHNVSISESNTAIRVIHPFSFVTALQNGLFAYYDGQLKVSYNIVHGVLDGSFTVTHEELGFALLTAQFIGGKIHGEAVRRGLEFRQEQEQGGLESRRLKSPGRPENSRHARNLTNDRLSWVLWDSLVTCETYDEGRLVGLVKPKLKSQPLVNRPLGRAQVLSKDVARGRNADVNFETHAFLKEDNLSGEVLQRIESFMRGDKKAFTLSHEVDLSRAIRIESHRGL